MYQLFLENQSMEHTLEQGRFQHNRSGKQHFKTPHMLMMLKELFERTLHSLFAFTFRFFNFLIKPLQN